jgi:O-antigen ligase
LRVHDGAWFALAFLLGAGVTFAAAYLIRYRPGPARQRLLLQVAAGAAAVALVAGAGVIVSRGNPVGGSDVVTQNPERLLSRGSNNRWDWWKEAWQAFEERPLGGTGAGSFELLHRKLRKSNVDVREVHNLPLQFASETGLVGLLFAAGAAAAALLGAAGALGRLDGAERAAAAGLAVVLPTFLVHSVLDYDWEFVALCGPLFFVAGVLLSTGRPALRTRRRPVWALAMVLVAWAVLYSVAAPRFAAARVDNAYAEIDRGSVEKAIDSAKSAHSLNPLSIDPLLAWASAEEAQGRLGAARDRYVRAVELQPLNWYAWYQLGSFDKERLADTVAARRELGRAVELDPHGCPARRALGQSCQG